MGPITVDKIPEGCSSSFHITDTTTTEGSSGVKKSTFISSRPGKRWKKSSAIASEMTQTGTVLPSTKPIVTFSDLRKRRSFSRSW